MLYTLGVEAISCLVGFSLTIGSSLPVHKAQGIYTDAFEPLNFVVNDSQSPHRSSSSPSLISADLILFLLEP